MNQVSLDSAEMKDFLQHIIENNKFIQDKGKIPTATEIVGDSGLGKTSVLLQVAKAQNLDLVKLNLAQIEELGDLVGFPVRQFEMKSGPRKEKKLGLNDQGQKVMQMVTVQGTGEKVWVDENATDEYIKRGFSFTSEKRMSYCPPEWIAGKTAGGILMLDDWNRADIRFIQAIMELVDRQEYISWKLPKNWHILLTANPDNGDYLVNSIDTAQRTRFVSVVLKWSVDRWAEWAEQDGIDGRCINFALMHPEIISARVNPRSLTTFFNCISSIKDFNLQLPLIQMVGEGSVGPAAATLFSVFIGNNLDKMISPKEILFSKMESSIATQLTELFEVDTNYRGDIASILAIRICNYVLHYAESNPVTPELIDRLMFLIKEDKLFTNDLKFILVKKIIGGNKNKFKQLLMDNTIQEFVTK